MRAVCHHCKKTVQTKPEYRDVPFNDTSGIVVNILCYICNECGSVVAVPAQSTPAIKRAYDEYQNTKGKK